MTSKRHCSKRPHRLQHLSHLAMLALAAGGLAGCVSVAPMPCPPGTQPGVTAELVFGRNIGNRPGISEAAFRTFLDREVTPRFPDGFTVLDTRGQWREAGRIRPVREAGKLLLVALPAGDRADPRPAEIAEAYKAQFRQTSVLRLVRDACVGF